MATYVRYRGLSRPLNSNASIGEAGVRLPSALGSVYPAGTAATVTTSMTGTNNDVTLTAKYGGTWGHNISLKLTDPSGNDKTLAITKTFTANAILFDVSLATGSGGAITTTATQLVAALNADPLFAELVTAIVKVGDTGASAVTALSATPLASGADTGTAESLNLTATSTVDVVVDIESRVVQRYLRRNSYRLVPLGTV